MNDSQKAKETIHKISAISKILSDAEVYNKAHQYKDALNCYQQAVDLEPENAIAWHKKAEAQVMCLEYQEAIESCSQAAKLNPTNAATWFLKSFAYGVLGQYQDALDSCSRGLELDPSNKMVWCTRGQYLYALGRLEEALKCFSTALKMNPESDYFQEVAAKVTKWLQRDGQSIEYAKTVMDFLRNGGYKEALDSYQNSIKINPRSVSKAFEKDFALAHLENPEKILKDYEKTRIQDQPQIILEMSQKEFEFSRESWVEIIVMNKGKTAARNINFSFSSEIVMKLLDISADALNQLKQDKTINIDSIPEIAPGNQVKKLISLTPAKLGQFSVEVHTEYFDIWGSKQSKTNILWISSFKPSEQLSAIPGHKMLWRLNSSYSSNIYVAQKISDSTKVVIKITNFNSEQSALSAQFLNETKLCSRLIHPNIIKIFQYGESPAPWVSMEYMPQGSLSRKIGKLNIADALQIAMKIVDALAFARSMRINHRNIHPDNVLFDAKDTPKLTNWRTSAITQKLCLNNNLTEIVTAYYPPEKLFSGFGTLDWLSDIYQFGVLFYEMLTGNLPFPGKGNELISNIAKGNPLSPSNYTPVITKELDLLVVHCLAKSKKDRFQSFSSLKVELEQVIKIFAQKS
jgi:tetratricopeptide (TPR) repeat protein